MSTPTVKITVGGKVYDGSVAAEETDPEVLKSSLFMMYVQGVKGDQRHQFVVFPPALAALDVESAGGRVLLLARKQEFAGNRSKWFHFKMERAQAVSEIESVQNSGFVLTAALAVPLEVDDYRKAWSGDTPHKALRAVDRALTAQGLSLK